VTNERPTAFYIHTLAIGAEGLELLPPERIVVEGEPILPVPETPARAKR
jgi:hypothetical protein